MLITLKNIICKEIYKRKGNKALQKGYKSGQKLPINVQKMFEKCPYNKGGEEEA